MIPGAWEINPRRSSDPDFCANSGRKLRSFCVMYRRDPNAATLTARSALYLRRNAQGNWRPPESSPAGRPRTRCYYSVMGRSTPYRKTCWRRDCPWASCVWVRPMTWPEPQPFQGTRPLGKLTGRGDVAAALLAERTAGKNLCPQSLPAQKGEKVRFCSSENRRGVQARSALRGR
jgi:hypothetical protein